MQELVQQQRNMIAFCAGKTKGQVHASLADTMVAPRCVEDFPYPVVPPLT
jgi:hypothetical protein